MSELTVIAESGWIQTDNGRQRIPEGEVAFLMRHQAEDGTVETASALCKPGELDGWLTTARAELDGKENG